MQAELLQTRPTLGALQRIPPVAWVVMLMIAFFGIAAPGFFTPSNFLNITLQGSVLLMMAVAATFVILSEGIDLSLGSVLTLSGVVESKPPAGREALFVEFEPGSYYRQFTLSDVIDQSRIEAKLTDGVLRLHLPKVEEVKPRQITVKAG
jgi:hypothetical protein